MIPPTDVIDLFAGPGGWSLAASVLGLHELGVEYEPNAVATRTAAGWRTIHADVAELDPANFAAAGLIASPPCQAFSNAGKGHGRDYTDELVDAIHRRDWHARPHPDPRVWLVLEVGRWIDQLRPEWVACEQVPAVLPLWNAYADWLRELGYSVWTGTLNAADFGVPQTRVRAFLIAHRTRTAHPPEPTHDQDPTPGLFGTKLPWVTMAEALGFDGQVGFPHLADGGAATEDGYRARDWRTTKKPAFTLTEKARSWTLRTGCGTGAATDDGKQRIDTDRQPAPTFTAKAGGQWVLSPGLTSSQPNRRLYDPEAEPAPTIAFGHDAAGWTWRRPATTVLGDPRLWPPGHKVNADDRRRIADADDGYGDRAGSEAVKLTPIDALVLQSFPPDYPVAGSKTKQFEQIGNAVPPLMAWHVLRALLQDSGKT